MPTRRLPAPPVRRKPRQGRAHQTVEAVLKAVPQILKRQGSTAVTTNRIAKVAGVSVGSVYQYFPDKQAIYLELHEQHVKQCTRVLERLVIEQAPLEVFLGALMESLIDAHADDRELCELLRRDVPDRADRPRHFDDGLRHALRLALSSQASAPPHDRELERTLFVVIQMLDALVHGAALGRPPGLSLAAAKAEAVRAVVGYVRGCGGPTSLK
jgi:AcrR family transcriptional regulator